MLLGLFFPKNGGLVFASVAAIEVHSHCPSLALRAFLESISRHRCGGVALRSVLRTNEAPMLKINNHSAVVVILHSSLYPAKPWLCP